MQKNMNLKGVSTFEGWTVGKNKITTLKLGMRYDEVVTSVNLLQGLDVDITVSAKIPNEKPMQLGLFRVNGLSFDKDGNSKITLQALTDNVELNNISNLIDADAFQVMFKALIEIECEEEED
jgi:hypothetical protein